MSGNEPFSPGEPSDGAEAVDVERAVLDDTRRCASSHRALCSSVTYDPRFLAAVPPRCKSGITVWRPVPVRRSRRNGPRPGKRQRKDLLHHLPNRGPGAASSGSTSTTRCLLSRESTRRRWPRHRVPKRRVSEGKIQDLELDCERWTGTWRPSGQELRGPSSASELRGGTQEIPSSGSERLGGPLVSNCVLNLVRSEDKVRLFREMYRV